MNVSVQTRLWLARAGRRWLAPLALLSTFAAAPAQAADPLTLREVIDWVAQTHPQAEAANYDVEYADATAMAARGGFDPMLTLRGKWTPVGYYPQGQFDALIYQPTPFWGASVFAGYRMGWGSYPIYKGDLQTLSGGEVRAGVNLPLWRDGPIDKRRAAIAQTKIARDAARQARDAAVLELEGLAAEAYWDWVAAGQQLNIAESLLTLAEQRQQGLQAQVDAGSVERIQLVDNRRLVLERSSKVIAAKRKLEQSALKLSLYTRDRNQQPIVVPEDRLPARFPSPVLDDISLDAEIERAIAPRPDILALRAEREAQAVKVRLYRNRRAPEIDLKTFVARDLGDGPAELRPTEFGVGVVFAMPLPLRQARGEYKAEKAKLAAIDAKLRGLTDKVAAEIRGNHVSLRAAAQSAELAREQVDVARELANAERDRLADGASSLLIVNIREQTSAKAQDSEVDALAEFHRARAAFLVSTGRSPQ